MTMKLEFYEGITTTYRARSSNVATITTSSNHGMSTGETCTVSGLGGTGYNDEDVTITVTSPTTFTYSNIGANESSTADANGLVFPNFTFTHNPNVFDATIDPFLDIIKYKYAFTTLGMVKPLMSTQNLVINGHFDGANKNTEYMNFLKHVNNNKLQKLFFSSSKFYIVAPQQAKKTNSGGRTMFIDYVANFLSPLGILFSSSQKSGAKTSTDDNDGNVPTPIEMMTASVTSGHTYIIKDKDGNGLTFTASETGTITIKLISLVYLGGDSYITNYLDVKVGTTAQVKTVATTGYSMLILLDPHETLANRMNTGSAAVTDNGGAWDVTFYWRDGYSSE